MSYDSRTALPENHNLIITDANTGNTYSVTIEKEIGRGGSCIVYRGTQKDWVGAERVFRSVIIKEFYPKALDSKVLRSESMDLIIPEEEREQYEDRLALFCSGQAKHIIYANENAGRSLPPVSFSGKAHNTFYAISNQGQGVTLSELNRNDISLVEALSISVSICDAIKAIHSNGMKLYLDLKPDNIYVFDNRCFLFDFDTVQPKERLKYSSYSDGWSAPEQVFDDDAGYVNTKKIGFHTDIYSIGTVLFYLIAGRKPSDEELQSINAKTFDWQSVITMPKSENALKDDVFVSELSRIMQEILEPDADIRKLSFGNLDAALKLKHELEHLISLVENAPYRQGFEDTNANIEKTKNTLENAIKQHSIKTFFFGSKKRIVATLSIFVVIALIFGAIASFGGKITDTIIEKNNVILDANIENHILLKLSNANHQYEVGLENWRRLDYNRAERDIKAALGTTSEEKSQQELDVARMNNSMGCLYIDMGKYADAYDYLNRAYVTFKNTNGDDSPETLAVLFSIAQHDYYSGDVESAIKTIQRINDIVNVDDNKAVATATKQFQAVIYDEMGNYDLAIETYQSVLKLYDNVLTDGNLTKEYISYVNDSQLTQNEKEDHTAAIRQVIITYNHLGESYIHSGNYTLAETSLNLALEMSLNNIYIGTKDLTTSKIYMNLAKLKLESGDIKNGIDYIDLAMRIQKNLFDFEGVYPGLVEIYDVYGDILIKKDSKEDAEKYYNDARDLALSSFGENHPTTAEAYYYLGKYQIELGDFSAASGSFEKAIEIRRNILGYKSAYTVKYLYGLAYVNKEERKTDKAIEACKSAEELCEEMEITGDIKALVSQLYDELMR